MTKEEKQNNFKRLAERRTNEVLKKIASFKNFANKSFYSYDKEQLSQITIAIVEELKKSIGTLQKALEKEEK